MSVNPIATPAAREPGPRALVELPLHVGGRRHHPHLDTLLITAGFVLVALYLGEIGPRTPRRFW